MAAFDPQLPRHVLDNLREGCQVISRDYRYLYVNDAVVRHGRTSREALLGRTMMEMYPGIENTEMFATLRRCMEQRCADQMENEFAFPDGTKGWFDLRFEPVPEGIVILSVDITERKRMELRLVRTMRALTTLSQCNQTLVRASDENQFLDDVSRLVVEMGGYALAWIGTWSSADNDAIELRAIAGAARTHETVVTAALASDAWPGSGARAVYRDERPTVVTFSDGTDNSWHRAAAEQGLAACIALPIRCDGRCIGVLEIYAVDRDAFDDDEHKLLAEVALDLGHGIETLRARAEQRRTRRQLIAAQRLEAVGRLAGGVAHDFNNLLSIILSYAGLASRRLRASDPVHAEIEQIHDAGTRAAELTRQLLAFTSRQMVEPRVTRLNPVVRGIERMISRLLGDNIAIDIHLADELDNVVADPSQLEQVVMNLVVNARDAMPAGGVLTIATANAVLDEPRCGALATVPPGHYVVLTVADTGTGMSPDTLTRIFEPFFTTKAPGKGTGLGLSTVYGIVKQMGGTVNVASELGRGTSFDIYLPRSDSPAQDDRAAPPTNVFLGHETILLVEDEAAVRRAAARVLSSAGYQVLSASDGDKALALCDDHDGGIDLLVSDIVMPGMDAPALAAQLQQRYPRAKLLFISGYAGDVFADRDVTVPGAKFLAKPFTIPGLTQKVREVLDSDD